MGDQGHYALLGFCPHPPEILPFVFPWGRAGKRLEAKGPVWGPIGVAGLGGGFSLLSFPGGTGGGGGGRRPVLSEAAACLRGQIAPLSPRPAARASFESRLAATGAQ